MKKVFIDSDVFVRDLRYPRDVKTELNQQWLRKIKSKKIRGVTSIFNVLEVCGVLSFNLSPDQLVHLYSDFCRHYGVQVLFPADSEARLQYDIPKIFSQIQKRQSLGDAQISYIVERFSSHLSAFVSWDARHFAEKLSIPVQTPQGDDCLKVCGK